jgi:hypothetical protein
MMAGRMSVGVSDRPYTTILMSIKTASAMDSRLRKESREAPAQAPLSQCDWALGEWQMPGWHEGRTSW